MKLVQHVLDQCDQFSNMYAETLREFPTSREKPWRIQIGCDVPTPGSKVSGENLRKNMCLMFNFIELGPDILECDATWFIPIVNSSSEFKNVVGGWSSLLRNCFRYLLIGPGSFTNAGILV